MNEQHRPTIRKFNPGLFQPDDEVIAQFVVRQVEFETVLEVVGDNLESPSCQHVLVVAPRGRGKTMLLARLAAECRTNEKYSRRIVPVRLMEECYEVFTLADFWLEALNGLAKEVAASDADTSLELEKAHAEFKSRWREQGIADRARAAVMGATERLDRHLVLMVENLQSLVDAVDDDFGWGLRHALQTEPRLTLVATATSHFRALGDAEHAFFELFRPVHLDPLDSKSCHRLWRKLGGGARTETEIEPVRILTGGSPRLIAMIASFASHFSLDRLLDELVGLIDSHTEYFRGHLEAMPKTERRVYLALADLWRPSTTGEVAARASLGIRTVSAMLGRLADRGAVLVRGTGKKREYSATEGLYCVYYKLRRDRGEAQIVRDLIRFMRMVFTEREQKQVFGTLHFESPIHHALRDGVRLAIADEPSIADLFPRELRSNDRQPRQTEIATGEDSVINEIEAAFEELDFEGVVRIADQVLEQRNDPSGSDDDLIVLKIMVRKAQALHRSADFRAASDTCSVAIKRFFQNQDPEIQSLVAIARIVKFTSEVKEENSDASNKTFSEFQDHFPKRALVAMHPVVKEMLGTAFELLRDNQLEDATRVFNELISRFSLLDYPNYHSTIASFYINRAMIQEKSGLLEDAISTCNEVVELFGDNPRTTLPASAISALLIKAVVSMQLNRSTDAIDACDTAVAHFMRYPEIARPFDWALVKYVKASQLVHIGSYVEAVAACDDVFEHFSTDADNSLRSLAASALSDKVIALLGMNQYADAIEVCELVERKFGTETADLFHFAVSTALYEKANAQSYRFEFEEALGTCETISRKFGSSSNPPVLCQVIRALTLQASMLADLGRAKPALRKCDDIEDIPSIEHKQMRSFIVRRVSWVRFKAYELLENHASATAALQLAFSKYDLDSYDDSKELMYFIVDAIARGTPEQRFLEVFAEDQSRSEPLAPALVALKRRANQTVRAPVEIVALADGIHKMIDDCRDAILNHKLNRVGHLRKNDISEPEIPTASSTHTHAVLADCDNKDVVSKRESFAPAGTNGNR